MRQVVMAWKVSASQDRKRGGPEMAGAKAASAGVSSASSAMGTVYPVRLASANLTLYKARHCLGLLAPAPEKQE